MNRLIKKKVEEWNRRVVKIILEILQNEYEKNALRRNIDMLTQAITASDDTRKSHKWELVLAKLKKLERSKAYKELNNTSCPKSLPLLIILVRYRCLNHTTAYVPVSMPTPPNSSDEESSDDEFVLESSSDEEDSSDDESSEHTVEKHVLRT